MASEAGILAKLEGNTMVENDVVAKLKHFSAQAAIEPQSPIALSQGLVMGGQQSMSSIADMSVDVADMSVDLMLMRAPAAAGSIATDRAIRSAGMVRPRLMDQDPQMRITGSLVLGSSDDFARCRGQFRDRSPQRPICPLSGAPQGSQLDAPTVR